MIQLSKKFLIPIILILCAFTLFGCKASNEINTISKKTILSQFEDKKTFLMVIGSNYCLGCKEYKETTLAEYLKSEDHIVLYYVDIDETFDDKEEFNNFLQDYNIGEDPISPTTYFIKNGEVVAFIEDNISLSELNSFISDNS